MSVPAKPTVLNTRIYGPRAGVWIHEFVTNSGLIWIFNALLELSMNGITHYVSSPTRWMLLAASIVQTTMISRRTPRRLWIGNFIAPGLYSAMDIVLDGMDFFREPYHAVFWAYAALMAVVYALYAWRPAFSAIAQGVIRTSLLPALYMISEQNVWSGGRMTLYSYWFEDSGHLFMLLSSLFFGLLLGVSILLRDRFERMLRDLAAFLERLTNWVFDPDLVAGSFDDTTKLALHRVERTILFMDIRGFTAWSERHDPAEVVRMLNEYYTLAEQIIEQFGGFKVQLAADEVMTRFSSVESGIRAALALQPPIAHLLNSQGLGVGIGLHTGDVVEGLIGSHKTRQYGIIGDAVNTAARLESDALSGEIALSETTYRCLPADLLNKVVRERTIQAKGKTEPLRVYILE